ncbi:NADP-dependent glyceraldehyde-3-phosphate dehydrogenase [Pedobacter sp.]|uniref:NADP-dependent glyceraldehyde-3-phosphate dehydrogenase n=1 Tax=Pedobacter sp. TaxID=1411316 RepID=UPI003D7F1D88
MLKNYEISDESFSTAQLALKELFLSQDEIPDVVKIHSQVHQKRILINGELRKWDGPFHEVFSPILIADKESNKIKNIQIGSYPLGTINETKEALDAAVYAFGGGRGEWPAMHIHDRIEHLNDFIVEMMKRKSEIVKLIVWEIGKTVTDAEKEFDRTIDYTNETIRAAKELYNTSNAFTVTQHFIGQTKKLPHGVVLCMGPFNYPLNETFTTLIPALIMGNTILFKPPKHGTLLFEPLLDAFAKCFPKGVVNTVYGRGRDIVPTLMESGKIDVLALIGSSRVADSLKKMHPRSNRLKSVLGLDAKNAAIILPDADLHQAVKECIVGTLTFNGQRCTAIKVLFVDQEIVDEFNKLLVEALKDLKMGMPWQNGVTITPLAEPEKPSYLKECIDDATSKGAEILNLEDGGGAIYGTFVHPTALYPVNDQMKIYHEEQFGPVIPVVAFSSLAEPIEYVTNSRFGQQVSIFSQDTDAVSVIIDTLANQVGRINLNSQCQRGPDTFPFNGRKDSAEGTLSVDEALFAFSVDSVVVTKQTPENERLIRSILESGDSKRLTNRVLF